MRTNLTDTFTLDGVRRTNDGYVTAFARVARTGIQVYKGHELGRPDLETVRVYRPPEEVFHADALRSFAHRPVTLRHPPVPVNAKNWKKYSRGQTGEDVVRDGEFVRVPLVMMDEDLIHAFEHDGVRELSMGYATDIKWEHGVVPVDVTDAGQEYDAVQTAIRGNHLAVVPVARGGDKLRVGDEDVDDGDEPGHPFRGNQYTKANPKHIGKKVSTIQGGIGKIVGVENGQYHVMHKAGGAFYDPRDLKILKDSSFLDDENCPKCGAEMRDGRCPSCGYHTTDGEPQMKTLVIDGISVSVADDQSGTIIQRHIEKLESSVKLATDALEDLKKKKKDDEKEVADAKAKIEAKDGEIVVLKKQVADAEMTPAKLDQLVKDRMTVITDAAKVLGKEFHFEGKTLPEIRKAAVELKLGDAARSMSDAAIEGAFAAIVTSGRGDEGSREIRDALVGHRPGNGAQQATQAYDAMCADLANAYKMQAEAK